MQQRRYRPGDVLDDYCPRERRITDHAIVAMIDDHIKQTRCCVCDADHEYKDGKVPPQRRKKPQSALFTQVLEGLQGPQPPARLAHQADAEPGQDLVAGVSDVDAELPQAVVVQAHHGHSGNGHDAASRTLSVPDKVHQAAVAPIADVIETDGDREAPPVRDEGPVRRPLIRATLPRPEGQPTQPTRVMPEFTIRQPGGGRGGSRPAGSGGRPRRGAPQAQNHGAPGPMRFGRSDRGHGGQGQGQGQGQRQNGGRSHGSNGGRPGGPRRGGKKR